MFLSMDPEAVMEVVMTSRGGKTSPTADAVCPRCGSEMDLHQPDLDMPDRLLGTCPECSQWTIVEYESDTFVWRLDVPSFAEAREAALDCSDRHTALGR